MKPTNQLLALNHEGNPWLRPEGKGTFMTSPALKESAEEQIEKGAQKIVIDLGACTGMDSTFMGTLAGIAKLLKKKSGDLTIVGASEKSHSSLEELGLNALMEIEGEDFPQLSQIRESYVLIDHSAGPGKEDHILECHENLCEADPANEETFKSVLEVLRQGK